MALADPSGNETRRIFIDAVDEAKQRRREPHNTPRSRHRRLIDLNLKQVVLVEKQQRILHAAIKRYKGPNKSKNSADKEDLSPEAATAIVKASRDITDQLTRLSASIRDAQEHEKKALQGLSHEELDDVLRLHLVRSAHAMGEAERRQVLVQWFGEDVTEVLMKHKAEAK